MSDYSTKIMQMRARLKDLEARSKKQNRRDETRRKILYGAAALSLAEQLSGESKEKYFQRLNAQITRASDRSFLKLDPLSEDTKFR